MYKVKNLYVVWEDDSSHNHLIRKEDYKAFEKQLNRIEDSFNEHRDIDIYYEELDDLLGYFSKYRLEGELHYVVLEDDVVDKDELEVE
ncbi:MAG: hypothetical protein KBT03_13120 [Bacteroidales bacterium]|nr:hypothetical protein [Candidatus Scybalousia scybalohippi]